MADFNFSIFGPSVTFYDKATVVKKTDSYVVMSTKKPHSKAFRVLRILSFSDPNLVAVGLSPNKGEAWYAVIEQFSKITTEKAVVESIVGPAGSSGAMVARMSDKSEMIFNPRHLEISRLKDRKEEKRNKK